MMMAPPIAKPRSTAIAKAKAPLRPTPRPIASHAHGRLQRKCAGKQDGLQRKLSIGSSNDPLEREADRIADEVLADRPLSDFAGRPVSVQRHTPHQAGPAAEAPASVHRTLAMPGRPLDAPLRRDMEARFGHDFSQVRVHDGSEAGQSARDVGASAYAAGPSIAFAPGRYAPSSKEGRRLLAHELAHVLQQGSAAPMLRRQADGDEKPTEKHLRDYNDKDPKHDPSRLADAQIEETVEFKTFMNPPATWEHPEDTVTRERALLATRLMLRRMRAGENVEGDTAACEILEQARKQLGTLDVAKGKVGKLDWEPFEDKVAKTKPTKLKSDFADWLLGDGTKPNPKNGDLNCWEMILFCALEGGYIDLEWLCTFYEAGLRQLKAGEYTRMGQYVEKQLRRGDSYDWKPNKPNSPEPLPGDIIIFGEANKHVAISLGTKEEGGAKRHHIISLHPTQNKKTGLLNLKTKRTTIEQLLPSIAPPAEIKFWSPNW